MQRSDRLFVRPMTLARFMASLLQTTNMKPIKVEPTGQLRPPVGARSGRNHNEAVADDDTEAFSRWTAIGAVSDRRVYRFAAIRAIPYYVVRYLC